MDKNTTDKLAKLPEGIRYIIFRGSAALALDTIDKNVEKNSLTPSELEELEMGLASKIVDKFMSMVKF